MGDLVNRLVVPSRAAAVTVFRRVLFLLLAHTSRPEKGCFLLGLAFGLLETTSALAGMSVHVFF